MRFCQLFSTAAVALAMLQLTGCAAPSAQLATGVAAERSPLHQAMIEAQPAAAYGKRAQ